MPAIIKERPELEPYIFKAFLDTFTRKEEVVAIWQELTEFRQETRDNFANVNKRLDTLESRFDTLENRFDKLESRFDTLENRFDKLESRFDKLENRFDKLESRFDAFEAETRANFAEVHARIDKVEAKVDELAVEVKNVYRIVGRLGSRWGIYTESLLRNAIAAVIKDSFGVTVERKIIDGEEFDIVIHNGDHILVEITSRAKRNIEERLLRKRDLYARTTGIRPTRLILAVGAISYARAQALVEAGFEVIEPDIEDDDLFD